MAGTNRNPFVGWSGIPTGDRFIGRQEVLDNVESRLLPSEIGGGNVAILGSPQVGKSSVAYRVSIEHKRELAKKGVIAIRRSLRDYSSRDDFFTDLVSSCRDEMKRLGLLSDIMDRTAEAAILGSSHWIIQANGIRQFYSEISEAAVRVLYILDEFDHARFVFEGDTPGLNLLRDLGSFPEYRVSFLVTARRSIASIVRAAGSLSTLPGIFDEVELGLFSDSDVDDYYQRLKCEDDSFVEGLQDKITFYCGKHPFLLQMIGFEIIEAIRSGRPVDFDDVMIRNRPNIDHFYENLIDFLSSTNRLAPLIRVLSGQRHAVSEGDVALLRNTGMIWQDSRTNQWRAFSRHFESHLQVIDQDLDYWSLWRRTERGLRALIRTTVSRRYGDEWFEELERRHPGLGRRSGDGGTLFAEARAARDRDGRSVNLRYTPDPLDYTQPNDLFLIIDAEWSLFSELLTQQKKHYLRRFGVLQQVRNQVAHNRDDRVDSKTLDDARTYCTELLRELTELGVNSNP